MPSNRCEIFTQTTVPTASSQPLSYLTVTRTFLQPRPRPRPFRSNCPNHRTRGGDIFLNPFLRVPRRAGSRDVLSRPKPPVAPPPPGDPGHAPFLKFLVLYFFVARHFECFRVYRKPLKTPQLFARPHQSPLMLLSWHFTPGVCSHPTRLLNIPQSLFISSQCVCLRRGKTPSA